MAFVNRQRRWAAAACAAALACANVSAATLRIKFAPGQRLVAVCDTDVSANAKVGAQEIATSEHQTFEVSLAVRDVKSDGSALVEQRFERMQVRSSGGGQRVDFDSAAAATGPRAAEMSAVFKAFQSAVIETHCDARGRVTRTNAAEALSGLVRKHPQLAPRLGNLLTDESVKNMTGLAGVSLPEGAVQSGDAWTASHERTLPLLGKQTVATEYVYRGPAELKGQPREKIEFTMTVDFRLPQNLPLRMDVAEQETTGVIWFDAAAGRVSDAETRQRLKLNVAADGQQFQQEVLVMQYTAVRPAAADAKALGGK